MSKGHNPFLGAAETVKRKAGGRAQRRKAEAVARKMIEAQTGKSVPAIKKLIRRNKQKQGKK